MLQLIIFIAILLFQVVLSNGDLVVNNTADSEHTVIYECVATFVTPRHHNVTLATFNRTSQSIPGTCTALYIQLHVVE